MSAPAIPPPSGPDYDRGPQLLAVYWVLSSTAILIQFGRLYCRLRLRQLGPDDWMMFFTVALNTAGAGVLTAYALNGGGRHAFYLFTKNPQLVPAVTQLQWAAQPFLIVGVGTGKVSVGLLLLRLLSPQQKWQRILVWFMIATISVILSLAVILTFAQCNPPAKLWNPMLEGTCWAPQVQNDYAMFASAYSAFGDVVLAAIPLSFIRTLNMSVKNRIALSILFGFGILAGIGGFYKTSLLPGIAAEGDFTWNSFEVTIWAEVEIWLVIVCGTMPTLKPLWDKLRGRRSGLTRNGYGTHYYGGKSGDFTSNKSGHYPTPPKAGNFSPRKSADYPSSSPPAVCSCNKGDQLPNNMASERSYALRDMPAGHGMQSNKPPTAVMQDGRGIHVQESFAVNVVNDSHEHLHGGRF